MIVDLVIAGPDYYPSAELVIDAGRRVGAQVTLLEGLPTASFNFMLENFRLRFADVSPNFLIVIGESEETIAAAQAARELKINIVDMEGVL